MKVIIIGGVAAGMSAAAKLKRLNKDAVIHVYEKGTDLSYSGCGMPYFLGDVITDEKKLIARTKEEFMKNDIKVFLKHEVIKVIPEHKEIQIRDLKNNLMIKDAYDKLLIATGTYAKQTQVDGSNEVKIHVLNQLHDMRALKPVIDKAKSVAIIGGGYIGVEVADNLIELDKKVHLIQRGDQLLSVYYKDIASKAKDILEDLGVNIYLNESLKSYEKDNDKIIVKTDHRKLKVDVVIEAIGVSPNTAFLDGSGINMLDNGAIITNKFFETNIKDIYAAGDCTSYHHIIKDELAYVPLGTHANKSGKIVAQNMVGKNITFSGIVGSNILKVGEFAFAKTGIGIDEAKKLNLDYDYVDITAKHQTSYYPGAKDLFIRFVYEKTSLILKGAELVGITGVSDRINIMALAITKRMTASEFAELDFAYAPPFSPVWDPLLIAASQIK